MNERGIILPLAGIIIFGVVVLMVALSVDTKRVKEAQSYIAYQAEQMCRLSSGSMPIARKAVDHALGFISVLDTDTSDPDIDISFYATLTQANFVSPNPLEILSDASPWVPGAASGWGDSITIYGHPDCPNSECNFSGDVSNAAAEYPTNFWSVNTFNGHLGCELTASVRTLVSGTKTARARAVYRVRLKGPAVDTGFPEGRGVIVGIAPQAEIRERADPGYPTDTRFHFTAGFSGSDPLKPGNRAFSYNRVNWSYQGPPPSSAWLGSEFFAFSPVIPNNAGTDPKWQRDEAKVRCYNPFVAARNELMQSVLGRIGRLWNTRANTQVLMVNPVNLSGQPNWPTVIVQHGDDMMQPQFEMPYVNYQPDPALKGTPLSPSGFLCPFLNATCNVQETRRHHNIVSSQMRDCFYVTNAANGAATFGDDSISNVAHEPPAFQSVSNSVADCPDPIFAHRFFWGWSDYVNHTMTAEDIARFMPTMEECPFTWADGDMGMKPQCRKPNPNADVLTPPSGLRGDLVAFFQYVNAQGGSFAYPSPGFFDLPAYSGFYTNPEPVDAITGTLSSHVVLFLNKRLNPADVGIIKPLVDNLSLGNRKLVVVYMPADESDWDGEGGQVETDLLEAFSADTDAGDPNFLFTLLPQRGDLSACGLTPVWQCFRDYWEQELLSDAVGNGASIAESILQEIFTSEVVL